MRLLRRTLRGLASSWAQSAIIIVILALGIGGAAAMFRVLYTVVLRPLPFSYAAGLYVLSESAAQRDGMQPSDQISPMRIAALRAAAPTLQIEAFQHSEFVLSGDDASERVIGADVTAGMMAMLGVRPVLGRVFAVGEDGGSAAPVVLLSHSLWQRRYGGDAGVVGRSIVLDGVPNTVIGVMPRTFEFPRNDRMGREIELWHPTSTEISAAASSARTMTAIARSTNGRPPVFPASMAAGSSTAGSSVTATPLSDRMIGSARPALMSLFGGVALLLMVVIVNTVHLISLRAAREQQAVAIRVALGASPLQASRPMLVDTLVLCGAGGVAAILAANLLRTFLLGMAPMSLPRMSVAAGTAAATALFITAATIVTAGIAITSVYARLRVVTALRGLHSAANRHAVSNRNTNRSVGLLVTAEIAVTMLLLSVSGMLGAEVARQSRIDPGFQPAGILTASVSLTTPRYRASTARSAFLDGYLERVARIPGVQATSSVSILPLGGGIMSASYAVAGGDIDTTRDARAPLRAVSPTYFATVGQALLHGRAFEQQDDERSTRVAIVNEELSRRIEPTTKTVGARLQIRGGRMGPSGEFVVIGVVKNAAEGSTAAATPMIYVASRQAPPPYTNVIVRSASEGAATIHAMRRILAELDPSLALDDISTLTERVQSAYALERFYLALLSFFAAIGIGLVALGTFGALSSAIAVQNRAMAIRLALGATPGVIRRLHVTHVTVLAAAGICTGAVLTYGTTPWLHYLMPARTANPAVGGIAAVIVLLAVTAAAVFRPILLAGRADPAGVLRADG